MVVLYPVQIVALLEAIALLAASLLPLVVDTAAKALLEVAVVRVAAVDRNPLLADQAHQDKEITEALLG